MEFSMAGLTGLIEGGYVQETEIGALKDCGVKTKLG
jgi:hypothetical protein